MCVPQEHYGITEQFKSSYKPAGLRGEETNSLGIGVTSFCRLLGKEFFSIVAIEDLATMNDDSSGTNTHSSGACPPRYTVQN